MEHHRAGGNPAAMANFDIAQYLCPRPNQNTIADLWVTFIILLARAAQGYLVQH